MRKTISIIILLLIATPVFIYASDSGIKKYEFDGFSITVIEDKQIFIPLKLFSNIDKKRLGELLPTASCKASVNVFLIERNNRYYLIDTGLGKAKGGVLLDKLAQLNITPYEITDILLTHLHTDHIGGLLAENGEPVFKNARLHISKKEHEFWNDINNYEKASEATRTTFDAVRKVYEFHFATLELFGYTEEVVDGIMPVQAFGHTAGHTMFEIKNGKEKIIFAGDILHCKAAQIAYPEISISYDYDMKRARDTRIKFFRKVAKERSLIFASHLPFLPVGRFEKIGKKYDRYRFIEQ